MELIDRLKTILKESNLKQKEFAFSIGVSEGYMSQLLSGKRDAISESLALLIQELYGYSADWVMSGKGDKFKKNERTFIKEVAKKKVESLTEDEAKAVIAFLNSIDEVRKIFGNENELAVAEEPDTYILNGNNEEHTVPVLGRVSAGMPILAIQEYDKTVTTRIKCEGALEIAGDSMNPDYKEGDIILIRKQPELCNGELGIIMRFEGAEIAEATFKKFYQQGDQVILKSINKDYPDQIYSAKDIRILGKVVGKA